MNWTPSDTRFIKTLQCKEKIKRQNKINFTLWLKEEFMLPWCIVETKSTYVTFILSLSQRNIATTGWQVTGKVCRV
jgi:hypothetical protein